MQSEHAQTDRPVALIALCQSLNAWGGVMLCRLWAVGLPWPPPPPRCCRSNVSLLCRGYLKALKENCKKGIQGACQILERHGFHDEM